MKGLEAYDVTTLGSIGWFGEVSTYIFNNKQVAAPGWYWTGVGYGGSGYGSADWVLETSWALLTLEKVVAVPPTPTPGPVGGIVGLPAVSGTSAEGTAVPAEGSDWSAGGYAALAGLGALALVGVAMGGWYVRRRSLR